MAFPDVHAPPVLWIDEAAHELVGRARCEGRVPISWAWGPDVRDAFSRFLDANKIACEVAETMQKASPAAMLAIWGHDDGRITTFAGLPAFPMSAQGMALRTVAQQD